MFVKTLDPRARKSVVYGQLAAIGGEASRNAYPPFSDYRVGVAAMLWDGRVFVGVNTENPGLDLTVHGEMSAVNAAISAGALRQAQDEGFDEYTFIKAVAVIPQRSFEAWPCGHCRDFLSSFGQKMDIIVQRQNCEVIWKPLSRILPYVASAADLRALTIEGHLPAQSRALARRPEYRLKTRLDSARSKRAEAEQLLDIARQAARHSYVPYSKRPAGAAVLLWDGTVYGGCRVENVGYTLSAHPEQVAINAAIADGALERARDEGIHPHDMLKTLAYLPVGQSNRWPSGSSRQCLCDWGLKFDVVVWDLDGKPARKKLGQLLPGAFVPDVLSYWTTSGS